MKLIAKNSMLKYGSPLSPLGKIMAFKRKKIEFNCKVFCALNTKIHVNYIFFYLIGLNGLPN